MLPGRISKFAFKYPAFSNVYGVLLMLMRHYSNAESMLVNYIYYDPLIKTMFRCMFIFYYYLLLFFFFIFFFSGQLTVLVVFLLRLSGENQAKQNQVPESFCFLVMELHFKEEMSQTNNRKGCRKLLDSINLRLFCGPGETLGPKSWT